MSEKSKKYQLNAEDGRKILKGCLIAGGGAALAYLAKIIGLIEFGAQTPLIVAVLSALINAAQKWLTDQTK